MLTINISHAFDESPEPFALETLEQQQHCLFLVERPRVKRGGVRGLFPQTGELSRQQFSRIGRKLCPGRRYFAVNHLQLLVRGWRGPRPRVPEIANQHRGRGYCKPLWHCKLPGHPCEKVCG